MAIIEQLMEKLTITYGSSITRIQAQDILMIILLYQLLENCISYLRNKKNMLLNNNFKQALKPLDINLFNQLLILMIKSN